MNRIGFIKYLQLLVFLVRVISNWPAFATLMVRVNKFDYSSRQYFQIVIKL